MNNQLGRAEKSRHGGGEVSKFFNRGFDDDTLIHATDTLHRVSKDRRNRPPSLSVKIKNSIYCWHGGTCLFNGKRGMGAKKILLCTL